MPKNLLDANLIIRFFVNDDLKKVSRVEELLKDTSNTNILLDTVIAEIVWVLSSYYTLPKDSVINKIEALIHVDSVECNSILISKALSLWGENNISYIDAYLLAVAELGDITLLTYDQKLLKKTKASVKEP